MTEHQPICGLFGAQSLGYQAKYVGLAWYPHTGAFTEADARKAIADFNKFGRTMKDAGLTFFYHNHGYEPVPYGDGTLMDLMIRETDPALVAYELEGEALSSAHGGPARLYVAPMYGYKSLKWLESIEVTSKVIPGYWEERGYDVDGWVGRSNGRDDEHT